MLLAPFEVFSNAMLAERWFPELVGWALAAAAMDLALLVLVLRLDADYLEWSTAISQRAYEQNRAHAPERRVRDQSLAEAASLPDPATPLAGRRRPHRLAADGPDEPASPGRWCG